VRHKDRERERERERKKSEVVIATQLKLAAAGFFVAVPIFPPRRRGGDFSRRKTISTNFRLSHSLSHTHSLSLSLSRFLLHRQIVGMALTKSQTY
jgi:hypothetical protein